jgi:hypothetical protein
MDRQFAIVYNAVLTHITVAGALLDHMTADERLK